MQNTNVIEQGQPVERTGTEIPVPAPTMTLCCYGNKLTREELAQVKTPAGTAETSDTLRHACAGLLCRSAHGRDRPSLGWRRAAGRRSDRDP